jgi:hypothetical protein
MTDPSDRDREVAELKARLDRLTSGAPPTVRVTGGPSSGGGFSGGFFGCLGAVAAIVALIVGLGVLGKCVKDPATGRSSGNTISAATSSPAPAAAGWVYASETHALDRTPTKTACVASSDQVRLDFPYHDTDGQLCLRSGPRGVDAYVSLNGEGQILCNIPGCTVHVRFDTGDRQSFRAVEAADNSTNIIFIRQEGKLISDLRHSKTTIVGLNLYQAGEQALTFNTAGLKWP